MKNALLILFAIFLAVASHAQGNLTFNRVILITEADGDVEVPEGTVWKVVSALVSDPGTGLVSSSSTTSVTQRMKVNGEDVFLTQRLFRFNGTSTAGTNTRSQDQSFGRLTDFPIWLPTGSTVGTGLNISGVSVIEFLLN